MFGQSSTPFGSPQGGFGQSNAAPGGFGSTNTSAFGTPAPAPTGFGGFGSAPAPAPTGFGGFGQAPTPTAFGGGTGGFGAPGPAPGFGVSTGGFGAPPSSGLFGAAPASSASGGLFGSAPAPSAFGSQPTNTAFGGGGLFGSTSSATPGFGSSSTTSAFGAAPVTGGGLFGSSAPAPAPIGFGSTSTGFGAPTTNVFGAPSPAPAGGLFGAPPVAPGGGLFGSAPSPGMSSAPGSGGTKMQPFQPTNRQDGTSNITLLSITAMQPYENKSFEELRYEDYSQGNKGTGSQTGAAGGFGAPSAFGGAPAPAPSLFGGVPAPAPFGAPATGAYGFGSPAPAPFGAPAPSGAFGTTTGFGGPAPTPGLFGAPTPAPGLFGSSPAPPATGGLFGGTPAPATGFGAPTAPVFGASQTPGLFGQTPAPAPSTGLFGGAPAPATAFGSTGAFGAAPPASGGFGTFGTSAPAPAPGGLFNTAPAPAFGAAPLAGGLFGAPSPSLSAGGFFGAKPPGTTGLFGMQPAPAQGNYGMTAQAPYGGYSQQPQAPVMVAPPPIGMVMPPATNEIMASQLAALESKRKELEQTDNFRSRPTESASITAISLGERESSSLAALTPMRASYFAYRPSPRSTAKIRPRGFASPTDKTTAMIGTQSLSKLGSGGKPMAAPETVAASSATRLIIAPSPKPKLRLTLGSNGDSYNSQQLRQHETTPLKLPGGNGISSILGSLQAKDSTGKRSEPVATPDGHSDASPKHGSSPLTPGGRAYEYYQQVIGTVDDESNDPGENRASTRGKGGVAPKLSKAGYTCSPSIATLQAMEPVDLAAVPSFSVQRPGVGKIVWEGAVDVRGADLDRIVAIEPKSVSVYTEEEEKGTKPPLGTKLNRPAILTLEGVFPPEGGGPESIERFARKVAKQTKKMDAELINYAPSTGEWVLRIHHFSKYGLDDDDSETEEVDAPYQDDQGVMQPKEVHWDFQSGEREGRSPAPIGTLKKKWNVTPHKPSRGMVLVDSEEKKDSVEPIQDIEMSDEGRVMEEAEAAFNNMQLRLKKELAVLPMKKTMLVENSIFPEESAPLVSHTVAQPRRYVYDACDLQASSSMGSISSRIARASSVGSSQTDFGLRMGRSFRVAWSPDGSLLRPSKVGLVLIRSRPKFTESRPEDEQKLLEAQRPYCEKVQVKKESCKLLSLATAALGGNPLTKTLESYCKTVSKSSATGSSIAKDSFSLLQVLQEYLSARNRNNESLTFGIVTQSKEQDLDNRILHAIGSWLVDTCSNDVRTEIQESKKTHEINKALLSAVSSGDMRLASSEANKCGHYQLSLMLVSGIEARNDILQEIDSWKRHGLSGKMPQELYRSYCLIAGDETVEEDLYKERKANYEFDWRRRIAMKLAYCSSQNPKDLSSLIQRYEADFLKGVAPFPAPLYPYSESGSSVPSVLFSLLKYFALSSESTLATTVNPLGYSKSPHDFSLSFHLACLISAMGFSEPLSSEDEYNLLDGFAAQLVAHGLWYWSVYVVLYQFDNSQTSLDWKIKNAKTLVIRNYDGIDVRARKFLEDLSLPSQWFEEALAYRCARDGDTHGYLRHMIQVDTTKLNNTVEKILIPNTLFLSGEKLADMLQLLKVLTANADACLASAVFDFFEIQRTIQMLNGKPREEIEAAIPALLEVCNEVEQVFVTQQSDEAIEFVPDSFVVPMASFLAEGLSQISLFRLQVLALESGESVSSTASQMLKLATKQGVGTSGFADRENICRWLM